MGYSTTFSILLNFSTMRIRMTSYQDYENLWQTDRNVMEYEDVFLTSQKEALFGCIVSCLAVEIQSLKKGNANNNVSKPNNAKIIYLY